MPQSGGESGGSAVACGGTAVAGDRPARLVMLSLVPISVLTSTAKRSSGFLEEDREHLRRPA
jgi:hypothetical protein